MSFGEAIQTLQPAHRRRRSGRADPGAAHLAVVGSDRDPRRDRERPRHRPAAPVHAAQADAPARRRRASASSRSCPGCRRSRSSSSAACCSSSRRGCRATRRSSTSADAADELDAEPPPLSPDAPERIATDMRVEPLELEIAYDLIDLVDASKGGDLLDRVRALRRKLALELGIVIPLVRTRDNLELPVEHVHDPRARRRGRARRSAARTTCSCSATTSPACPASPTREPVFGLPGDVGAARVPAPGRGHRRDRRRPRVGDHDAPRRGRAPQRGPAARPPGREAAHRPREADRPGRDRRAERRQHHDRRDPARAADRCSTKASASATSCASSRSSRSARASRRTPSRSSRPCAPRSVPRSRRRTRRDGKLPVLTLEPLIEHSLAETLRTGDHGTYLALDPQIAEQLALAVARDARRRRDEGHRAGARVRDAAAAVAAPAAARGRAAASRPRLHGARRAARARHDRGGEPWPASCGLRARSSRSSSSASATEVGPDARIVAANRVRKGGIGGFFAKQASRSSSSRRTAGAATTVDTARTAAGVHPRRPCPHRRHGRSARRRRAPATILELADAVSDDERNNVIDLVEERSVSTESRDFAQVLDRFSRSIDATPDELGVARDPDRRRRTGLRHRPPRAEPRPPPPARRRPPRHDAAADRADRARAAGPATTSTCATTRRYGARRRRAVPRARRPSIRPREVIDRYETRLSRPGPARAADPARRRPAAS